MDFWDDSADYFDTFFYTNFLRSLRRPEPPEQRLLELHPSRRSLSIAVADLLAAGALNPLPGRDAHPYRLSGAVLDRAREIETFCAAWAGPGNRPWLAALVGDWPAAHAAGTGDGPEAITAPRAARCRDLRRHRLLRETGPRAEDALHGLADLGAAPEALEGALSGPPSGLVSAALEIAGQQSDPRWCPAVYALFRRADPAGPIPEPHIWVTALKYLLGHGYRKAELLAAFPRAGGTEIGVAVLLALEHAPEHALPLIRKGLLADVPVNRSRVAAILAVIGRPWSLRELLGALEASDDQEKTADVRAALLAAGDPDAERAVLAWEERNPHEGEVGSYLEIGGRKLGPFYTFGEISLKNRAGWVRHEMDELHDRVMKVRDVVPPWPHAPRPWWKLWGGRDVERAPR